MGFGGISFGGSEGKSRQTTNPWAPQIPFLEQGFGYAQDLFSRGAFPGQWWVDPNQMQQGAWQGGSDWAGRAQPIAEEMMDYGRGFMPGMRSAQDFYQKALQGGAGIRNPYESDEYGRRVAESMWTPEMQNILESSQQSILDMQAMQDRDTRLGAAMAGFPGGSDQMRKYAASALGARREASDVENRLRMQGLKYGTGRADQWARQDVANQLQDWQARTGAAGALEGMGRTGMDYLTGGYQFGQGGYGDLAGWGDYAGGFDRERLAGQQAQWGAPWQNLMNYWNVIGSRNWGGTTEGKTKGSEFGMKFGF